MIEFYKEEDVPDKKENNCHTETSMILFFSLNNC